METANKEVTETHHESTDVDIDAMSIPARVDTPEDSPVTLPEQNTNSGVQDDNLHDHNETADVTVQSAESENMGESHDNDMPPIASVPPDFQFNRLLMDIENSISKTELDKLKSMLRGRDLLGERLLEEIDSASNLFKLMRQRCYMSCVDIMWLQAILQTLGRADLIERTIEYSNLLGNVIHFIQASEQPENGFRYVKFHVKGRDFRTCKRAYIENLRTAVARLVSVPPQFVMIVGIEPSSSLMVTLMIPELYVRILEHILKTTETNIEELFELDVDGIAIDQNTYNLSCEGVEETEYNIEQMKFVNVYQQLQSKSKLLEDKEIECMRLSKENKQRLGMLHTLQTMFQNVLTITEGKETMERSPPSLTGISGLALFQETLKDVSEKGYNMMMIQRLLEINTAIVSTRIRDNQRTKIQQLELALVEREAQLVPLKLEIIKYRFFAQTKGVVQVLTEAGLNTLKTVSAWLTDDDRVKLLRKYALEINDKLRQDIEKNPSNFLAFITEREFEKRRIGNLDQFIYNTLKEISRDDLCQRLIDQAKKQKQSKEKGEASESRGQQQRSTVDQDHMQNQEQLPHQYLTSVPPTWLAEFSETLSDVNCKVTDMHDTMKSQKSVAVNADVGMSNFYQFNINA